MSGMNHRIYVAGHEGMVGSAIVRILEENGYSNLICRTREQLDLTNQQKVSDFFRNENIKQVYIAAARVGGIHANNTYPAEFIYENLMIESNIIHQAYKSGVKKLLFLGSSCIYPRNISQPMEEKALLTSTLEPTNEPYAIAKIAGIKLCESYNRQYGVDFRSIMPTNLYGINDTFDLENSHVIPALMRRIHEAKQLNQNDVIVWGSGKAMREFLYVDDMAEASVFVMNLDKDVYQQHTEPMLSHINIGTGKEISIFELATTICRVIGFDGGIIFDKEKPDGSPRKLLNVERLKSMGWQFRVELEQGLAKTYQWYLRYLEK